MITTKLIMHELQHGEKMLEISVKHVKNLDIGFGGAGNNVVEFER